VRNGSGRKREIDDFRNRFQENHISQN